MSFLTYEMKFAGRTVGVRAQKDVAQGIIRHFDKLVRIDQYCRETSGIVGGEEHVSEYMTMFVPCGVPVRDPEGLKQSCSALAQKLPDIIEPAAAKPFLDEVNQIFLTHVPVKDARRTREEVSAQAEKMAALEAAARVKDNEWRSKWCKGNEQYTVQEGEMGIVLRMCYDNSDPMTDYFDDHAGIGDSMLLAVVPKGARTEKLARGVLARYPYLAAFTWKWAEENYANGHGNYLQSGATGHVEPKPGRRPDSEQTVPTYFEVSFYPWKQTFSLFRDYPGETAKEPAVQVDPFAAVPDVTVRKNEVHQGIEVVFTAKPPQATLDGLKGQGFRWSGREKLWYTKYSETKMAEVKKFLNIP